MSTLWLIAATFVLVWIAEAAGVAQWFPFYGATGLLISMLALAIIGGSAKTYTSQQSIRKIIREELGRGR